MKLFLAFTLFTALLQPSETVQTSHFCQYDIMKSVEEDVQIEVSNQQVYSGDSVSITVIFSGDIESHAVWVALRPDQSTNNTEQQRLFELVQQKNGSWSGTYEIGPYDSKGQWNLELYYYTQEWKRKTINAFVKSDEPELIDEIPPIITAPNTLEVTVGNALRLETVADNESGLREVSAVLTNGEEQTALCLEEDEGSWVTPYIFTKEDIGEYHLVLRAVDVAGNVHEEEGQLIVREHTEEVPPSQEVPPEENKPVERPQIELQPETPELLEVVKSEDPFVSEVKKSLVPTTNKNQQIAAVQERKNQIQNENRSPSAITTAELPKSILYIVGGFVLFFAIRGSIEWGRME
ncbi:hypothetical protein P6P90_02420 [Ectobacillus antri]|jgi:hypothetical protein|uniref:Ig-like domain-containing protein n=1 Tax=Ectobacillus antri TaxID=2486280 RepID=A0ABT6H2K0_9BACI|nr:hypothetical protein [Ectobacillus antri]MDG4656180.1 hypothetical protein [Ectobacillus antri]MDG5752855.1 hypothetical protein [Ectobacillus antri]